MLYYIPFPSEQKIVFKNKIVKRCDRERFISLDGIWSIRRAVRYVRYNAEKFGIDKNKILVIGSSAGGHLTALLSTYTEKLLEEGVDEIGV